MSYIDKEPIYKYAPPYGSLPKQCSSCQEGLCVTVISIRMISLYLGGVYDQKSCLNPIEMCIHKSSTNFAIRRFFFIDMKCQFGISIMRK